MSSTESKKNGDTFNTITGADWKRSLAEAKGRPNALLQAIKAGAAAALREKSLKPKQTAMPFAPEVSKPIKAKKAASWSYKSKGQNSLGL